MSLVFAAAILVTAPVAEVDRVDAAYDALSQGRNAEAAARIENANAGDAHHPAAIINLGVAYARIGRIEEARTLFERAASASETYALETSNGQWVESDVIARRALVALDSGRLGGAVRTASR